MVERDPSKVVMRVRFSSPAPETQLFAEVVPVHGGLEGSEDGVQPGGDAKHEDLVRRQVGAADEAALVGTELDVEKVGHLRGGPLARVRVGLVREKGFVGPADEG